VLLFTSSLPLISQDKRILGSFILKQKSYNFEFTQDEGNLFALKISQLSHYVKRVSVEIADGAIKNLIIKVVKNSPATIRDQSPWKYTEFKNQFPIRISGQFDSEYFNKIYLYCFDCNAVEGLTRYIKLSDLLALDLVLENNEEDYRPSDRTVVLSPLSPIAEWKKEKRTRLIELAAFSDFAGDE